MKDILKKYLSAKRLSQNDFARLCGLSSSNFTRLGENTACATLKKIDANSDLNVDWLLTGEGEMLKSVSQNANNITGHNVCGVNVNGRDIDIKCPSEYETLLNIVKAHNEVVTRMQNQLDKSQIQLDKAQTQIDDLLAIIKTKL